MFDPFNIEDIALDEAIASAYSSLTNIPVGEDGYSKAVDQISKLYALKNQTAQLSLQAQKEYASHELECDKNAWSEEQDEKSFFARLSPDTVLTVAGSLITAVIVIKYEQTGVISSKALSFMRKF